MFKFSLVARALKHAKANNLLSVISGDRDLQKRILKGEFRVGVELALICTIGYIIGAVIGYIIAYIISADKTKQTTERFKKNLKSAVYPGRFVSSPEDDED